MLPGPPTPLQSMLLLGCGPSGAGGGGGGASPLTADNATYKADNAVLKADATEV